MQFCWFRPDSETSFYYTFLRPALVIQTQAVFLYCNYYYYSMNNVRLATSIHILTLLAHAEPGTLVSSEFIAGSVNTNPAVIRKELGYLRRSGLVASKEGKNGGNYLAKKASDIRMSDIYESVKQSFLLGKMNTPNPKCPVGRDINNHLNTLFSDAEASLMQQFDGMSLQDFTDKFQ